MLSALVALALSGMLSTSALASTASGAIVWHNPETEKPHSPVEECWTYSGTNIDFCTNSPEILIRYVLEDQKVPKGATERAALGVDLYDIDNDGGFHLLEGDCSMGDTVKFSYTFNFGNARKYGNEFRLYLPLYNKVKWMEIGVQEGHLMFFEPVPMERKVVIRKMPVEGVSRPAESIVNVIQRKTDFPAVVSRKKVKGPRISLKSDDILLSLKGKDVDTTRTVEAVYNAAGTTFGLPEIVFPVRQRRDRQFYDWAERHAKVLYRERVQAPNPDIIMIGNSITHYWSGEPYDDRHAGVDSWDDLFKDYNVTNIGYGWDRLGNMMWRVMHEEMDGFDAKEIFMMAGTNDIGRRTEQQIAEGTIELLKYIRVKQPKARIHLVHIYPRRSSQAKVDDVNSRVDALLKDSGLDNYDVVDVKAVLTTPDGKLDESLFSDGLHPNEKGYRRIASVYRNYL